MQRLLKVVKYVYVCVVHVVRLSSTAPVSSSELICCPFFVSKMPEREDDHLTPATRLLEKRREMSEVEQALAAQKEVCYYNTVSQKNIIHVEMPNNFKLIRQLLSFNNFSQ